MSYTIRQNPSPFFTSGRPYGIKGLVLHHAATTDFDGIGRTFKTAGVSAGYGVMPGVVDQYVADGNIAYHAGNWEANQKYIGIEHVNSGGAPAWPVSDATLATSHELAADLVRRHGLGSLVPFVNLFPHNHFSPTFCPGVIKEKLAAYAAAVNTIVSGGTLNSQIAPQKRSNDEIATEVLNGKWGNNPQRAANLRAQGYNPDVIQAIVNARLGVGVAIPAAPASGASVAEIARQVIAGSFGNGADRIENLKRAGYDYAAVQAEVNRQLGVGSTVPSGGIIAVGAIVTVANPVDYNGTRLSVSGRYQVMEVRGDRAVIGRGGVVTAAIRTTNLRRA